MTKLLFAVIALLCFYLPSEAVLKSLIESKSESSVSIFIRLKALEIRKYKKALLEYLIQNEKHSVSCFVVLEFLAAEASFFFNAWGLGLLALAT